LLSLIEEKRTLQMEIIDKSSDIYQFTIFLIFLIALIFFVYMYWYANALQKSTKEKERVKRASEINALKLDKVTLAKDKALLENQRLEMEQAARTEKNLRLEQEVSLRNKELTTSTILISQQKKTLEDINTKLSEMKIAESGNKEILKNIKKIIRNNTSIEDDWANFKKHFEQVYPDFFENLSSRFSNLTQNDLRHCAYIRMQLNTKEIARLLNINPTSVQISRVRLKKKLNIGKEIDLRQFIMEI